MGLLLGLVRYGRVVNENPELLKPEETKGPNIKDVFTSGKEESNRKRSIHKVNKSKEICAKQNVNIGTNGNGGNV